MATTATYKYLDYAGLQKFAQIINDKFIGLGINSNGKIPWDSIEGKPTSFTPSSHTQHYTSLTGSTAIANQAIVSSGTANGWTLKTLGDNAFNSTTIPTKYADSDKAGGAATSANKLNTDAGSATKPVYFSNGIPVECTGVATDQELADAIDGLSNVYLGKTAKAVDADKLDGQDSSHYATAKSVSDLEKVVEGKLDAAKAMVYKGTVGTGGTVASLPASHKVGDTYKVITAGTYAGEVCTVGDMIICNTTDTTANDAHWDVIQDNVDLVGAQNTIGLVKNGSSVTSASGYTPSPIISGVPYYKDTTQLIADLTSVVSRKAPTSHAVNENTYGLGTAGVYGHVKLVSGDLKDKGDANGMAAAQNHTHGQYVLTDNMCNLNFSIGAFQGPNTYDPDAKSSKFINIPTNTSHLTNDSNFITSSSIEDLDSSVTAGDPTTDTANLLVSVIQTDGKLTGGTYVSVTKIVAADITWDKLLA